jgi:hypothetical protein
MYCPVNASFPVVCPSGSYCGASAAAPTACPVGAPLSNLAAADVAPCSAIYGTRIDEDPCDEVERRGLLTLDCNAIAGCVAACAFVVDHRRSNGVIACLSDGGQKISVASRCNLFRVQRDQNVDR